MAKAFQTDIIFKGKVDSSFQKAVASIGKQSAAITKKLGKAAVAGFAAASVAAAGFSAVAVKSAVDFQAQMSNVGTLLSGTQQEVAAKTAAYSKDIKRISGDTGATTELLTDGMYQVVSAFGEVGDASKILEISAKAATAGNATVTDSVNLLSAVTKGYGDTSAEANQKAADLAFATVKLGQTTFPEMAASMGKAVAMSSSLGVAQEQLFGAMATLTGVTGNTAEVSTQLTGVMGAFLAPSDKMSKALKSLGYSSGQAILEANGLQGSLELLKSKTGGTALALSELFSEKTAKTAVLSMAGAQMENLTEKTQAMYEATGAAQAAFDTQTDNFAGKMNKVKAKLNVLAINAGETLLPVLAQLADKLLAITNSEMFANLENQLGYLVNGFSAIFGEITSALSGINLNFAIDGMGDFDIFAEAAKLVKTVLPPVVKAINAILPPMMQLARSVLPVITRLIENLLPPVMDIASAVLPAIMEAAQALLPVVSVLGDVLGNVLQSILPALLPIIERLGALFSAMAPAISFVAEFIGQGLTAAFQNFAPIIDGLMQKFSGIIDFLTGVFTGNWQLAWDGIKNIFFGTFKTAAAVVLKPLADIISGINIAIDGINKLGSKIGFTIPHMPQIPGYANGGTVDRATLAYLAEEPGLVETVVPHRKNARSQALAMTAARGTGLLGRMAAFRPPEAPKPQRMGGGMTKVYSSSNRRGGDVHITYAPVIHAEGGETGVKRALDKDKYTFAQMIEEYFEDKDLVTV